MANSLYNFGRQSFLDGTVNWMTDTIQVSLVVNSYSPNLGSDQYLSDIGNNIIATQTLLSKTSANGTAGGGNMIFPAVMTGFNVFYLVIFKSTGVDSTSPLIALIDTASGLPITTTGADINIIWDAGINKIFTL